MQIAAIATRASANGERATAKTPSAEAPIAAGEQLRRDYSTDRA
jgi:hypothetical protein